MNPKYELYYTNYMNFVPQMKLFDQDEFVEQQEGKSYFIGFRNQAGQKNGLCLLVTHAGTLTVSFFLSGVLLLSAQHPICYMHKFSFDDTTVKDQKVVYMGPIKEKKRHSIGIQKYHDGKITVCQYDYKTNKALRFVLIIQPNGQMVKFLEYHDSCKVSERFGEQFPTDVTYKIEKFEPLSRKIVEVNQDLQESGECAEYFKNGYVLSTLKKSGEIIRYLEIIHVDKRIFNFADQLKNGLYQGTITNVDGSVFNGIISPYFPYPIEGFLSKNGENFDFKTTLRNQLECIHKQLNLFPSTDCPVVEELEGGALFAFKNADNLKNGYAVHVLSEDSCDVIVYVDGREIKRVNYEKIQFGSLQTVEDGQICLTVGPINPETKQFYGLVVKIVENVANQILCENEQILSIITGGAQKNQVSKFIEKYSRIRRSYKYQQYFPTGAVYKAEVISPDGTKYVGDANERGLRHGYGELYKKNGAYLKAIFKDGVLVREIEVITRSKDKIDYVEKICDGIYDGIIKYANGSIFEGTIDSVHVWPLKGVFKTPGGEKSYREFLCGKAINSVCLPRPEKRFRVCSARYRDGEKI